VVRRVLDLHLATFVDAFRISNAAVPSLANFPISGSICYPFAPLLHKGQPTVTLSFFFPMSKSGPPSTASAHLIWARIKFEQCRDDLHAHCDTIPTISDKNEARTWAEEFGKIMVRLFYLFYLSVLFLYSANCLLTQAMHTSKSGVTLTSPCSSPRPKDALCRLSRLSG
jgi:hypothetical protein